MHHVPPRAEHRSFESVRSALQRIWGYDSFRSPQDTIIKTLLQGGDAIVVMPTGGGKSLCFQLPALLHNGLTIVVSPLVALMENQVRDLQQRKLPAALLHSQCSKPERSRLLQRIRHNRLRLLYVSPETLLSPALWQQLTQPQVAIAGLIIDEAHCLVQWGDTFRPAYRRLGAVRPALQATQPRGMAIATAAFTATANPQAQAIIEAVLGLRRPHVVRLNPYRENLALHIQTVWTPRGRRSRLRQWLRSHAGEAGLIYVRTRRETEALSQALVQQGYVTAAYHGGLSAIARRRIEADWLSGTVPIVVCTSAFGMGIDKPDCRWVVQWQAPTLLSEYVQEVGRAGRDGNPATALTFISEPTGWLDGRDRQQRQSIQQQQRRQYQAAKMALKQLPQDGHIQTVSRTVQHSALTLSLLHRSGGLTWPDPFHYRIHDQARLHQASTAPEMGHMVQFLQGRRCRWQVILSAFGFSPADHGLAQGCGHCDRCLRR